MIADEIYAREQDHVRTDAIREAQDASQQAQKRAQDAIQQAQEQHGSKRNHPVHTLLVVSKLSHIRRVFDKRFSISVCYR